MQQQRLSIRALAGAAAAVIVAGAFLVFGGTSDAHHRAALAAAGGTDGVQAVAIEPLRIDVVVVRDATRTAARVDERSRPKS